MERRVPLRIGQEYQIGSLGFADDDFADPRVAVQRSEVERRGALGILRERERELCVQGTHQHIDADF